MGQIPTDYDSKTNVTLVKSLMSSATWTQSFPFNNLIYTYDNFLRAVAKFPMFCNEVSSVSTMTLEEACKQEIATLLAHISYESGSL